MKTYLFDFTNRGILYVIDYPSKWNISALRACIPDTSISRVSPKNPLYTNFNNVSVREQFYQSHRDAGIFIGNEKELNNLFLEKRRLAHLMMPVIATLTEALYKKSFNLLNQFGLPIDDTISFEVLGSNPETNSFSCGVIEYANTLGITPLEAYTELKVEYESAHSIKMRSYAVFKKYQALIREIKTSEDATQLISDITQKLINDTYI